MDVVKKEQWRTRRIPAARTPTTAASHRAFSDGRAARPNWFSCGTIRNLRWLNGEDGKTQERWPGKITALDAERLLEHTNAVHGLLRWELEPVDGVARLIFTNRITPGEEKYIAMSLAGWHAHFDHLVEAIEDRAPRWNSWYQVHFPAWEDVHADYQRPYELP